MSQRKKVLYVIHRCWPYLGGAERLFWEWAKGSRDAGDDVTIYTTDVWDIEYFHDRTKRRIETPREVVEGITIRRFRVRTPPPPFRPRMLAALAALPSSFCANAFGYPHVLLPGYLCEMIFTRQQFDLVNTGVFPHLFLTYPAVRYAQRMKVPVVCTPLIHLGEPHSGDGSSHFLSVRHLDLLAQCDKVVTMTDIERQALLDRGIAEERVHVVGAGVAPEEVWGGKGRRFRERYGIRGKLVLQISTQTHDKGAPHTLEAMKRLWARGNNATLVFIGQVMSDFDTLFCGQPPWVYEKTLVLDYIDEQTKRDALDACDVLVMPSKAESFGIVYLEAWLYKKPVIGAWAGGVPALVEDGKDGLLVPYADVHMLAEYITMLLETPQLADALGTNGYWKVLRRYTWKHSCERLRAVYATLGEAS